MSYLNPLHRMFPVPLEGGIPHFWQLAGEWRHRSPGLWDAETKRAARWANGPLPGPGWEPRWTVYDLPPQRSWPPALPPGGDQPATVLVAPPSPPTLALEAPAEVAHDEPAGWPAPSAEDDAFLRIWDEPPGRPFLGRWRRK